MYLRCIFRPSRYTEECNFSLMTRTSLQGTSQKGGACRSLRRSTHRHITTHRAPSPLRRRPRQRHSPVGQVRLPVGTRQSGVPQRRTRAAARTRTPTAHNERARGRAAGPHHARHAAATAHGPAAQRLWGEARALGGTHAGGRWGPPARRRRRFFGMISFFARFFTCFHGNSAYLELAAMLSRLATSFRRC